MATLTVQPSGKDNYFQSNAPNDNNGSSANIDLCNQSNNIYRIPLAFDISALPSDAVITSAKLSLYYYSYYIQNPSGVNTQVYKITRNDWHETQSTWNSYKTSNSWTTAGGDYVTSNPSGASQTIPASYGWVDWDVKAIAEDAIENVSGQVNVIVKFETESGATRYQPIFYSNNYSTQTSLRPKLVIEYTTGISGVKVNVGGTFKTVSKAQVNVGSNWKNVSKAQLNKGGVWKTIF